MSTKSRTRHHGPHWPDLLQPVELAREMLETAGDPVRDTEALLRVELAEVLARAAAILRALANDGE